MLVAVGYVAYPTLHQVYALSPKRIGLASATMKPNFEHREVVVLRLYKLAADGRWSEAYALLSPKFRKAVSFEQFRQSYENFASMNAVVSDGDSDYALHAHVDTMDRSAESRHRTFAVDYTLVWTGTTWLVDDKVSRTVADTNWSAHPIISRPLVPRQFPAADQASANDRWWETADNESDISNRSTGPGLTAFRAGRHTLRCTVYRNDIGGNFIGLALFGDNPVARCEVGHGEWLAVMLSRLQSPKLGETVLATGQLVVERRNGVTLGAAMDVDSISRDQGP